MHELSVTQSIIDITTDAAHSAGGYPITAINLVIGDLSSIVDESVQFYFDLLSEGTLAEGAVLRFQRERAQLTCQACAHQEQASAPLPPRCPGCGSAQLLISGGKAFYVESIEVANESPGSKIDSERQRPGRPGEPLAI